jgi:hypothetical protein
MKKSDVVAKIESVLFDEDNRKVKWWKGKSLFLILIIIKNK